MFAIKIDDRQVLDFVKKSPRRAEWAMREALLATGGHLRKKVIDHIESAAGWPALSKTTIKIKQTKMRGAAKLRTKPLSIFARLVRYRYYRSSKKGVQRVRVGFFNTKNWFKRYYGVGAATIAYLHESGRKSAKYGKRRIRKMIEPVWMSQQAIIPGYVSKKFFENLLSKKKPGLKF